MKKRLMTSLIIVLTLALAFVLKALVSDYFFDAFILFITCYSCFEMSKLLTKMGRKNYKWVAAGFPIALFISNILGFVYDKQVGTAWTGSIRPSSIRRRTGTR